MSEKRKRKTTTKIIHVPPQEDRTRESLRMSGIVVDPSKLESDVLEELEGHVMELDDVIYYAHALNKIADYCRRTEPDAIISTLRGSLPPTRILVRLLGEEFDGSITHVPTSNFVEDRKKLIYASLEDCIKVAHNEGQDSIHMFTVDLARSGTSTKRYGLFLKKFIPQIINENEIPDDFKIKYSLLKLWHKASEVHNNPSMIKTSNPSRGGAGGNQYSIEQGVFFIPDWLSEDNPELLGIDYPLCIPEQRGVKMSYAQIVQAKTPIVVLDGDDRQVYSPIGDQSSADVFVDLVVAVAGDLVSGNISIPDKYQ